MSTEDYPPTVRVSPGNPSNSQRLTLHTDETLKSATPLLADKEKFEGGSPRRTTLGTTGLKRREERDLGNGLGHFVFSVSTGRWETPGNPTPDSTPRIWGVFGPTVGA